MASPSTTKASGGQPVGATSRQLGPDIAVIEGWASTGITIDADAAVMPFA